MTNQTFGEAVTKLANLYNLDNVVCTAADSDTGEGCTLIRGNNAKLLIMLAVSTLKDVSDKVGMEELEELMELAEHEANKREQINLKKIRWKSYSIMLLRNLRKR